MDTARSKTVFVAEMYRKADIAAAFRMMYVLCGLHLFKALPVRLKKLEVLKPEFLPPDHIPGQHHEHDGHENKDFHHEAFLGTLIEQGKLKNGNMDGYKFLIDIFHKLDKDQNHRADESELKDWIHDRINDHFNLARDEAIKMFEDIVQDPKLGLLTWSHYKSRLVNDEKIKNDVSIKLALESDTPFSNLADAWSQADSDGDQMLNRHEFVAFIHPETNRKQIQLQAQHMLYSMDKDQDHKLSVDEYAWLPVGEVDDAESKAADVEYLNKKRKEFHDDIDLNKDGFVTKDELSIYLDARHIQHAIKEAQYLIKLSDRDSDGRISEYEMLSNFKLFTGSDMSKYALHMLESDL